MGPLEIQLLKDDRPAREALEIEDAPPEDLWSGLTRIRLAADLASALPGVARLTPLMISLDHLLSLEAPPALGQEFFTVEIRRTVPVRTPDERLEGGPERFDIIELACGEMEISAMVAHGAAWPHVTVHRAWPRAHPFEESFSRRLERAFFAALRDAVLALRREPSLRNWKAE